jgi:hypothetical protein
MSHADDNDRSTLSNNIYIPVSIDKTAFKWNGNDACILGLLYETDRYYKRTGLFQPLIKHRAVALSNGRLAVEDPNAVYFVTGRIHDARDFESPCPPTVARITEHNAAIITGTRAGTVQTLLTEVPDANKTTIVHAPHSVEKEDSTFLYSLSFVFGDAEPSEQLLEQADGSGLEFLRLLRARGEAANARDRALVMAEFSGLIRDGVVGELTLGSFGAFLKSYKAKRRNIAPSSRPSAEAEVEMISVIAIKDPASRELYELKAQASPPTTLEAASDILSGMLRGRIRCEEIDALSSGPKGIALASEAKSDKSTPQQTALLTALAALGLDTASIGADKLTALAAALVSATAPADPRKTDAGKDKNRVAVPRDADGKPTKWVEGMARCRCGVGGGKHLFKDCPKAKEKKEKALAAEAAKAKAAAGALPDEDQLRSALAALLAGGVPPLALAPPSSVVPGQPVDGAVDK